MKQKFTITIADVQINIVTDEPKESVDAIVGILDRRIREIYLQSGNRCPKNEAALLCALDYCAERYKLQETVSSLEAELKNNDIEAARAENAELTEALAKTRALLEGAEERLRAADADAAVSSEQLRILTGKTILADEIAEAQKNKIAELEASVASLEAKIAELEAAAVAAPAEETVVSEPVAEEPVPEPIAEEPSVAEEILAKEEAVVEELPAEETESKKTDSDDGEDDGAPELTPVGELAAETAPEIELKPLRSQVDENQLTIADAEKTAEPEKDLSDAGTMEKEKQKAQKRVRSMFDLITFDNV